MLTEYQKQDQRYLGDGVMHLTTAIRFWVRAERDGMEHSIAFEPGLIARLVKYERDIHQQYAPKPAEDAALPPQSNA